MNSLEMMKRHLGKPVEIEVEDDKIMMAPLEVDDLPSLIELQSKLAATEGKEINKELASEGIELMVKSILNANPDAKNDVELVRKFVGSNFLKLIPALFKINSLLSGRDIKKAEKIAKIKERVNESNSGDNKEKQGN